VKNFLSLLILFLLAPVSLRAQIPKLIFPDGLGVNIHFVQGHKKDLDLIAAAGFKFVRMDFSWEWIEQKKGEYDWSPYDELTANLKKRGLGAIFIFDYSHSFYEEDVASFHPITHAPERRPGSPQHPESIAAFARWAAASAKHFHGQKIIWEIFNEPNGFFWKPKPDANQYTALAFAVAKAIRAAEKKATIIGPATSGMPFDYLEIFLKSGVLEFLDAVSVHPYRGEAPETAGAEYKKLREMIDRYAPKSRKGKIPILSGEWGYASQTGGFSVENQAAFAVRQQLFNLLEGIPLSIWYDWKNDGLNPHETEQNFGTVFNDLKPKPAYLALQKLTRELSGFRVERLWPTERKDDFVLLCVNQSGAKKLAVWTAGEPHTISISPPENSRAGKSLLELELRPMPKYFSLPKEK